MSSKFRFLIPLSLRLRISVIPSLLHVPRQHHRTNYPKTVQVPGCHPPALIRLLLQLQKLLDFFCLWSLKCMNNTSPRCTQYRLGYYHQPRLWLRHFSPGETRCLFFKPFPVSQSQSSQTLHLLSLSWRQPHHINSRLIRIVRNI